MLDLHRLNHLIKPYDIAQFRDIFWKGGDLFWQVLLAYTEKFGQGFIPAQLLLKDLSSLLYIDLGRVVLLHLFIHRTVCITHSKLLTGKCHSDRHRQWK